MGWMPNVLLPLLDKVENDYRIDPERIVVTGLSMGGRGTWQLAAAAPERFAAIAPICGHVNPAIAPQLDDLPTWVFHGMLDEAVDIRASAEMVNALNELEAPVRFTVYPDGDHGAAWKNAYNESGLLDWLLKAKR
jgi:predicted peptidase